MSEKNKGVIDLSSSLTDIWKMLTDEQRELLRSNARILHFKKMN